MNIEALCKIFQYLWTIFLEIVFLEKQSKKLLCYFFNSVTIVIVK